MLALLTSSIVLLVLILAMGKAYVRAIKLDAGLTDTLFLGMAMLNTVCAWVSLAFPVGFTLMLILLGCSAAIFFLLGRDAWRSWRDTHPPSIHAWAFWVVIGIAFLAASGRATNSDTVLYHLATIKWYETYPVVPGLANLDEPLAYNQNLFLLYALTSIKTVFGREVFSVNFVVFAIFIGYLMHRLHEIYRKHGFSTSWFFYLLLALLVLRMPNLSSPSPDYLSQVLPIYITLRILDLLMDGEASDTRIILVLFILACYCMTVKLTSASILALFLILAVMRVGPGIPDYLRMTPWVLLIIVPWFTRNVIMTGWLVFPFPAIDLFSFDWKTPVEDVISRKFAVTVWARVPVSGGLFESAIGKDVSYWFPLWLKYGKNTLFQQAMMVMGFLFPIAGLVSMWARWVPGRIHVMALLITCVIGMQFWFWSAPSYRMGVSTISISALSPLLWLPKRSFGSPGRLGNRLFVMAYAMLALYMAVLQSNAFMSLFNGSFIETGQFVMQPRMKTRNPQFPKARGRNFEYYHPVPDVGCYDFDLPCTPTPDSTLMMRGPTFREGFRKVRY